MGEVRTEITLDNVREAGKAQDGLIPESEVRRLTVSAVVDTGAGTLIINEEIRQKLGRRVEVWGDLATMPNHRRGNSGIHAAAVTLAGGIKAPCRVTELVKIYWKNRRAACEAVVVPGEEDVLLGALPLEAMDLTINPLRNEVTGAHGDKVRYVVK
jgi:predicted aspartyl protease